MVEKLASHGCSAEQIRVILDCDHRTIERRFAPILKKARLQRDGRLQVKLCQEAMGTPLQHRDRHLSREKLARNGRSPGYGG